MCIKPDLYYEKSLRHELRQALRQGKPLSQAVASCRKLSQRLIAKVEPGSTFATAIVRRVRQTSYFYDCLLRFPGNRREFRSRKW